VIFELRFLRYGKRDGHPETIARRTELAPDLEALKARVKQLPGTLGWPEGAEAVRIIDNVGHERAWCTDRLVGVEELGGVGERPFALFLLLDPDRAVQAEPGPPPPYSATAAQGHELAGLRRQLTPARKFDGLVHRRGDHSLEG
jgi:hypothetical protein